MSIPPYGVNVGCTITFPFAIGQKVKTVFGCIGIVRMLSIRDHDDTWVFIQFGETSSWFNEFELEALEE